MGAKNATAGEDLLVLANDLRLACQIISRRVRFEGTSEVAPHQYSVLVRLWEAPRSPTQLAEIERVSTPSMTRTVNGLVDSGLVQRQPHPTDGRQVALSLTEDGTALVRRTMRERDSWMMRRLEPLSSHERERLRELTALLLRIANE